MTDWKTNRKIHSRLIICWIVSLIPFAYCLNQYGPADHTAPLPGWLQIYLLIMLIWTTIVGMWPTGPNSYPFE